MSLHDELDDIYHVYPEDDLREHIMSKDCWCKPKQDEEMSNLYIHNSMDGREYFETGKRKVS